jgi:capsular exopolysaccharide synthesis family protein
MTLRESLRVMRRWRSVIAAGVLIGVVVGWMSAPGTAATTTVFQATHTLIADPQAGGDAYIYRAAVLAKLGAVPGRVAARLGIDRRRVQSMLSTETPVRVKLLLITGRSADRAQAEALADVTAEELIVELGGPKAPLLTLEAAVASPVETEDIRGPSSRPDRALLLGAFGLLLGVGAAFAVDRFDNRIRSKPTAEAALGVAVVAEVPSIPRSARGRLLVGTQPSSFIEAHRRLRTIVDRWTPRTEDDDGHRVIVVTSTTADEGKTTTVAHLAATLAEIGRSVLVISADLRRPRLHLYFDRPREPGLVDVLRGAPDARRLADLNLTTAIRGVRFVASGAPVDNPAPLLHQAGDLLREARGLGDFVLVDSPPLLTSSAAADLARHADGVLLVVRAGRTSIAAAARSAELLQRLDIPVLGAVLVASDTAPDLLPLAAHPRVLRR